MLDLFYQKEIQKEPTHARSILNRLIYLLPFVIQRRALNPNESTKFILSHIEEILNNKNSEACKKLEEDIETAYLNKEIERMYERLAKAGKDTATVSDKLNKLKSRYRQPNKFRSFNW